MSVVKEIIRLESDETLSFGNYIATEKQKIEDFEALGDLYKVKTHKQVTRLEKNGRLLLESIPGSAIYNFQMTEDTITFAAAGFEDTNITAELESETMYEIFIDGVSLGQMRTNVGGKITFSIGLNDVPQHVRIKKNL